MLKFCVIEDNLKMLNKLTSMLENIFIKYDFDAEISFKTTTPNELLAYLKNNKVDVLIIDIELNSSINGLCLAEKIRKTDKECYFIFITGHFEFMPMAYKYKTFDFLSKPITKEVLEQTMKRLFDDISGSKKKFIKLDNKNTIINEDDIKYIKRDGMKVIFHTNSRDYEIYSSFNKLQNKLPNNFIRCHKSFIANINNVTKVEPLSNMIYFTDSSCDIGPKYKNNFMEMINNYGDFK